MTVSTDKNPVQEAHNAFRVQAETGKAASATAFALELVAAAVAILVPTMGEQVDCRLSLLCVLLLLIALAARHWSRGRAALASRLRRASLGAYSTNGSVSPLLIAEVRLNKLPRRVLAVINWWSKPSSLEEYYEPSLPVGLPRAHELNAHSAFYTGRLLRYQAWVFGGMAAALFGGVLVALNDLAASGIAVSNPQSVSLALDSLYSLVLGVLGARALESCLVASSNSREVQRISGDLLSIREPDYATVEMLSHQYDAAVAGGPKPSTILHRVFSSSHASAWSEARKTLHQLYSSWAPNGPS
jgi:hypothetical protein